MLTLFFDERLNILSTFGVPLSTSPIPMNNVVNLTVDSRTKLDINSVQKIYEASFKNYFGYAYSLTFSKETASDIVQDVFARIVAKVNRDGHLMVENLEAYVIRAIRNEHIDRKRKDINRRAYQSVVIENTTSAEQDNFEKSDYHSLKLAIQKLSTAQRTCLVMYYFNEMKVNEIAKEIGISASAVKTHIQRARKTLGKNDSLDTVKGSD